MFDDEQLRLAYDDALSFNATITKSPLTNSYHELPMSSVGIAYFLTLLGCSETAISCLIVCLLKIMFCQIIKHTGKQNLGGFPKLLEHFSHRMDLASIPGLQDIPSLDLIISVDGRLTSSTGHPIAEHLFVLFSWLILLFIFFSLVRNEHPSMHPFPFIPMGNAFQSFRLPCSYFHYRRR